MSSNKELYKKAFSAVNDAFHDLNDAFHDLSVSMDKTRANFESLIEKIDILKVTLNDESELG